VIKTLLQTYLLIAEAAAYYKSKQMTLYEGLMDLYEAYGYYREDLESLTLKGKGNVAQIAAILSDFRNNPPKEVAGKRVLVIEDYQSSNRLLVDSGEQEEITLPKSNVIKYKLENGSWICLRPSEIEPNIKTLEGSAEVLEEMRRDVMGKVE